MLGLKKGCTSKRPERSISKPQQVACKWMLSTDDVKKDYEKLQEGGKDQNLPLSLLQNGKWYS